MTDSVDPELPGLAALLERWSKGEKAAYDQLLTHLYGNIHAIAVRHLHRERYLTIRPTALVHEVYLRLSTLHQMRWQDRAHFLAMAARVTRQALVDEARRRRAEKRDGGWAVTLSDTNLGANEAAYDALDVDDLLSRLQQFDAIAANIFSLRVFGGMSIEEVAEVLKLSVATVNRRWVTGKAWLARELTREA
jgi:RNA polymerase sigma-70 factor, ECF subfamily